MGVDTDIVIIKKPTPKISKNFEEWKDIFDAAERYTNQEFKNEYMGYFENDKYDMFYGREREQEREREIEVRRMRLEHQRFAMEREKQRQLNRADREYQRIRREEVRLDLEKMYNIDVDLDTTKYLDIFNKINDELDE